MNTIAREKSDTNANHSARVSTPSHRANYQAPVSSERLALLRQRRSSRRARRENQVTQHNNLVTKKALSALGTPDGGFDFFAGGVFAVLGYDLPESQTFELYDEALARHTLGYTHRAKDAEKDAATAREADRRRKQRERLNRWQERADNPLLFEHDNSFNKDTGKRNSTYRFFFPELVQDILKAAPVGSSSKQIDAAVARHCSTYLERFTGEARKLKTKQTQSAASNIKRAGTVLGLAISQARAEAIQKAEREHREQTAEHDAETAIFDLLETDFLAKLSPSENALFYKWASTKYLETQGFADLPTGQLSRTPGGNPAYTPLENRIGQEERDALSESAHKPKLALVSSVVESSPSSEISPPKVSVPDAGADYGQTDVLLPMVAEFIASNPAYRADAWRDAAPTDKQRDLLYRAGVYADVRTRGEASDRIAELMESGALCDWLSLAELENFDSKAGGRNKKERRFCCPLCGTDKKLDAEHRSLSANTKTGEYHCHRCKTGGILREFTDAANAPARSFPVLPKAKPEPIADEAGKANRWRKFVADAATVSPDKPSKGAEYLASRGIPADVASVAGVRFGMWWKRNDDANKPEPFAAVVFPLFDQSGELVAAQARSITGDTKRTKGDKSQGVFLATPGALEADRLAICEAPIDALALAACGLEAIALCGTSWPEWLLERISGAQVLVAFDADKPGDEAADKLAETLTGLAFARRLRPAGGKDWNEVLQRHGKATIEAQIDFVTGNAEPGAFDEMEGI